MNLSRADIVGNDERIWDLVLRGDSTAFQQIVERYQGAVAGVAFSRLGEFAASQDVAQETFWIAWKSREQLREPSRLGGWLCGIARNLASKWRRDQGLRVVEAPLELADSFSRELDPAEQSISREEEKLVWSSLESLPENYRDVLVLYYRQGQSIAEVAAAMGLSEDAVKQRLSRGREMIRVQLAGVIEDVLVRSCPGRGFTRKVIAGLAGMGAMVGVPGSTAAATVGGGGLGLGSVAASSLGSAAGKTLLAGGAGAGLAGGLLGAAGGLAGAWFGTWLPAQLAPTMSERRLLERYGRRVRWVTIGYTLGVVGLCALLWWGNLWIYLASLLVLTLGFIGYVIGSQLRLQRSVRAIRQSLRPEDDPNPAPLRARWSNAGDVQAVRWRGRKFTSSFRLLGRPILDIQFGDCPILAADGTFEIDRRIARGWLALGDRAHGIVLGVGGVARGLIAIGGVAYGGVALGGVALGIVSLGGLALGLLAAGGCAIGQTALGGGALGWDAAGGLAVGWHSAAGGLAAAWHIAFGGLAVAVDYAVGGQAYAAVCNSDVAREVVQRESLAWLMEWYQRHSTGALVAIIALACFPALLVPWAYCRESPPANPPA